MIFKESKSLFFSRFFILLSFFLFAMPRLQAQQMFTLDDLQTIKVDDLSDEQIKAFAAKLEQKNIGINDLETEAKKRGMPEKEWLKLKKRLSNIGFQEKQSSVETERESKEELSPGAEKVKSKILPENTIFGRELFSNKSLTFEPNLKMATPLNYQLGPGDELQIDIYGYSEQSFAVKVSPDGKVRIPNMGIISVGGLTIEQATSRIRNSLSSYIEGIQTGTSKLSISLGNIRSIKVILVGEVTLPGSYTLPSLATVFNALYVAGGPSENGSFRNISVVRNNKVIAKLDVYDFLKTGVIKENIRLQDQDVIKVFPYENRVQLKGQVKRQGFFEVKANETLKDLLATAGGFKSNAFQSLIKVTRNTPTQKSVGDIPASLFSVFNPLNGDVFQVDSILNRYENRVQIKGAVFRPGDYSNEEGLTVGKLIQKASGLTEDAFTTRAIIYRLKDDNSLEMISFNVNEVLKGNGDISLKREDLIQIASKQELKEGFQVSINGEVIKPGVYSYADNMRIEDLIIASGGFKETASIKRIEVARRKFDVDRMSPTAEIASVKQFNVEKDLKDNPDSKFILEPFDVVTVFRELGFSSQKLMKVEGEVLFPGVYAISRSDEKVTDIIQRSGGLSANGFPEGAMLMRPKQQSLNQELINYQKQLALKRQSKDTTNLKKLMNEEDDFAFDIVGLDLVKLLKNPSSKDNLLVKEGDILIIPDQKQTVQVTGEVLYPVRLNFKKGQGFKGYISNAGGFSSKALKKRAYVVYANGTAEASRGYVLFRSYPKIAPGCEIVVPQKEAKRPVSAIEYVTILTSLTSLMLLTYSIMTQ